MERPANISEAAWKLLNEKIDNNPGPLLIAAGILKHPELLEGIIISVPLKETDIDCLITKEAAEAISLGTSHIRVKQFGVKREYLVPIEIIIEAFKGDIDYVEKN